ncbi:MAG: selenocysteine lyase/cysteine desulfurase [Pseudomonadales bacterium]|jgi:selenocysteine lyase/cysteine desulfurase
MKRREFLTGTSLAVGVSALASNSLLAAEQKISKHSDLKPLASGDWSAFRDLFPLRNDQIQLASFLLTSHPKPVTDAINAYRQALDYDPVGTLYSMYSTIDGKVRDSVAQYMGTSGDQIALTDSTTMGLAMVYSGLSLQPGDEILHTTHYHYSTFMSIARRAERTGAKVRQVSLYDNPFDVSVDESVKRLVNGISDATKVIGVTWVHSSTGVKLPIRALSDAINKINAKRASDRQIIFCVDGVHGFGIENIDISALACDFFIAGTHKWIFGPRGTGIIWGSAKGWEQCKPVVPGFGRSGAVWRGTASLDEVPPGEHMTPGGFHSFEHRWALPEAFKLHLQLGKAQIQKRIHQLNTQTKLALSVIPNVKLYTPISTELSSGFVCFDINGMAQIDVVKNMYGQGVVMSNTPYRESYARFAPSLFNDEKQIAQAVEKIAILANK